MEGSSTSPIESVPTTIDEVIAAYREFIVASSTFSDEFVGANNSREYWASRQNFESLMVALPAEQHQEVWNEVDRIAGSKWEE